MRRLILSDIHANIDALEAVLNDARGLYEEIVCCGDLVGYGGAPAEVVEWAINNARLVVRGNHDRVCAGIDDDDWFNEKAREAVQWTASQLSGEQLDWLAALPEGPLLEESFAVAHGSPADEDQYLLEFEDVCGMDDILLRPVTFFGHTHLQGAWTWFRGELFTLLGPRNGERETAHQLSKSNLYLINPGSVGQPRDRDPRAAYVLWDSVLGQLSFRRTPYNVEAAQERITSAGLPRFLAERLAVGH